jgi:hypothetical protein
MGAPRGRDGSLGVVFDHVGIAIPDLGVSERFYHTILSVLRVESGHPDAELVEWEAVTSCPRTASTRDPRPARRVPRAEPRGTTSKSSTTTADRPAATSRRSRVRTPGGT